MLSFSFKTINIFYSVKRNTFYSIAVHFRPVSWEKLKMNRQQSKKISLNKKPLSDRQEFGTWICFECCHLYQEHLILLVLLGFNSELFKTLKHTLLDRSVTLLLMLLYFDEFKATFGQIFGIQKQRICDYTPIVWTE